MNEEKKINITDSSEENSEKFEKKKEWEEPKLFLLSKDQTMTGGILGRNDGPIYSYS